MNPHSLKSAVVVIEEGEEEQNGFQHVLLAGAIFAGSIFLRNMGNSHHEK
jgi:hypothetical protein